MQGGKGEAVVRYREPYPTWTPKESCRRQWGIVGFPKGQTKLRKKCIIIFHLLVVYKSNNTLKRKVLFRESLKNPLDFVYAYLGLNLTALVWQTIYDSLFYLKSAIVDDN